VDPLVDETGQPYAYTGDDPVNGTDPMGLFCLLGTNPGGGCRGASEAKSAVNGLVETGTCLENSNCLSPQGLANAGAGFADQAAQLVDGLICNGSNEEYCPTWSVGAPFPCGPEGSYQVGEVAFFGLGFVVPGGDEADAASAASESAIAASPAELASRIDVATLSMTNTVQNEAADFAKNGSLNRPYISSPLTIQNIVDSALPVADPGGVPTAVRWDAPGTFRGSPGTYQLVIDAKTNTILHFMFTSG
jgi:hypothetical protein